MIFKCQTEIDGKKEEWTGEIKGITDYGSHYEIFIESRSSITIILGRSSLGGFACIPDFQAGCHLIGLDNMFWNCEKLVSVLGKVDGVTAATALRKLSKKLRI